MMNKLMETINTEMDFSKNNNTDCFVIIRNPLSKITHWKQFGYNVTYDCVHFDNVANLDDFIHGVATYDYIDNSCKLHDDEMVVCWFVSDNKYINLKTIITALYDDFYINAINDHNGKNWKYQYLSDNVLHSLENLHDDIIDNIIWKLFDENNENYGFGMLEKFNNYNHACFEKCVSRLRGEIYDHENDTLITIEYINPYGDIIGCKHIGNFSNSICKSIKRRFDKLNYVEWDDLKQSGLHCMVINRNYCTNHGDFEYNHNVEWLNYEL